MNIVNLYDQVITATTTIILRLYFNRMIRKSSKYEDLICIKDRKYVCLSTKKVTNLLLDKKVSRDK